MGFFSFLQKNKENTPDGYWHREPKRYFKEALKKFGLEDNVDLLLLPDESIQMCALRPGESRFRDGHDPVDKFTVIITKGAAREIGEHLPSVIDHELGHIADKNYHIHKQQEKFYEMEYTANFLSALSGGDVMPQINSRLAEAQRSPEHWNESDKLHPSIKSQVQHLLADAPLVRLAHIGTKPGKSIDWLAFESATPLPAHGQKSSLAARNK